MGEGKKNKEQSRIGYEHKKKSDNSPGRATKERDTVKSTLSSHKLPQHNTTEKIKN